MSKIFAENGFSIQSRNGTLDDKPRPAYALLAGKNILRENLLNGEPDSILAYKIGKANEVITALAPEKIEDVQISGNILSFNVRDYTRYNGQQSKTIKSYKFEIVK